MMNDKLELLKTLVQKDSFAIPRAAFFVAFIFGAAIGVCPTEYGDISKHPLIFEILPLISGLSIRLAGVTGFGFMLGDLLTRGTHAGIPAEYFIYAHIGVLMYSVLPGLLSRFFVYYVTSRGIQFLDGGSPTLSLTTLLASAAGGCIGTLIGFIPVLVGIHISHIYAPQICGLPPDTSCNSADVGALVTPHKVGFSAFFSGPIGGVAGLYLSQRGIPPEVVEISKETLKKVEKHKMITEVKKYVPKDVKAMLDKGIKAVSEVTKQIPVSKGETTFIERLNEFFEEFNKKYGFKYNITSNSLSIVSGYFDDIISFTGIKGMLESTIFGLKKEFWSAMKKFRQLTDELTEAGREYRSLLRKTKVVMNQVIKPKGCIEAAKRVMTIKKSIKTVEGRIKSLVRKISRLKKLPSKVKGMLNGIGYAFLGFDITKDTVSYMSSGEGLVDAYSKSAISNYIAFKAVDANPGLAIMEIGNMVFFGDTPAGNIISPSTNIKGAVCMLYDAIRKGGDVVIKNLEKGKYGECVKWLYEAGKEAKEWLKDPSLIKEVIENKGLAAGLKGEVDKLGEFMDGIHDRIDQVVPANGVVSKLVNKSLHLWTNATEFTIRSVTSLVKKIF